MHGFLRRIPAAQGIITSGGKETDLRLRHLLSKGNTTGMGGGVGGGGGAPLPTTYCIGLTLKLHQDIKLNNKPQTTHSVVYPIINWVDNSQKTYKYLKKFSILIYQRNAN